MPEQFEVGVSQKEIIGLRNRLAELENRHRHQLRNESRWRLANRIMSEGLWEWDLANLQIWWDEAYDRLYGPPPESAERAFKWWLRHIHSDDRQAVLRATVAARDGSTGHWKCKYRFLRRDGSYAFVLDRALIFRDGHGKAVRILGTLLDLTERKKAILELEEANRRKDQVLAMVSHELRNPVNAIAGWVSLLRSQKLDKAAEARAFEIIEQNAKFEARLIEDLLDFSRILTGKLDIKLKPLDFTDLARLCIENTIPAASSKGIQFDAVLEPTGMIAADACRLRQILENIFSNAIKFTPEGGRIEVRMRKAGRSAELTVTDTGLGIPPEMLSRIFEEFWQLHKPASREGGLGLGLAISAQLVKLHGGTIKIDSKGEGEGTTAKVNFPIVPKCIPAGKRWIPRAVRSLFRNPRSA